MARRYMVEVSEDQLRTLFREHLSEITNQVWHVDNQDTLGGDVDDAFERVERSVEKAKDFWRRYYQ